MSLFYIDIRFPSSVNEGHSIDTQFCTHDLIKEDDWNDHLYTQKIVIALHALIFFIAYHKNDLEILTVATICPVSKLDHRVKRYHMIKFARLACIVSR